MEEAECQCTYLYGFGFGISFDWSSQTGAGSAYGLCGGGGGGVGVGGIIGPLFVFQSTRIDMVVDTSIDIKTAPVKMNWKKMFKR